MGRAVELLPQNGCALKIKLCSKVVTPLFHPDFFQEPSPHSPTTQWANTWQRKPWCQHLILSVFVMIIILFPNTVQVHTSCTAIKTVCTVTDPSPETFETASIAGTGTHLLGTEIGGYVDTTRRASAALVIAIHSCLCLHRGLGREGSPGREDLLAVSSCLSARNV